MKNYFAKLRENEEKGFSLVELIIVMAIMAILVGVVASQVIPYMEKSRQAKDQQQLSGIATDITASIASAAVTAKSTTGAVKLTAENIGKLANDAADEDKIIEEFATLRGATDATGIDSVLADLRSNKLKSKAAKNAAGIFMTYDVDQSKLTIFMSNKADGGTKINKLTVESE